MEMNILELNGMRGYIDDNGIANLHIRDVAIGLGFTQIAKSGNLSIRWERINKYLDSMPSPQVGTKRIGHECPKDSYITESEFYMLCMKANNEVALKFQQKVCEEILPTIRRTGMYTTKQLDEAIANKTTTLEQAYENQLKEKEMLTELYLKEYAFANNEIKNLTEKLEELGNFEKSKEWIKESSAVKYMSKVMEITGIFDGNLRLEKYQNEVLSNHGVILETRVHSVTTEKSVWNYDKEEYEIVNETTKEVYYKTNQLIPTMKSEHYKSWLINRIKNSSRPLSCFDL